jgi:hypothetical protein
MTISALGPAGWGAPLRPSGGRGRGPRAAREGEVGAGQCGIPHLTPTLSAPKGGEGDNR